KKNEGRQSQQMQPVKNGRLKHGCHIFRNHPAIIVVSSCLFFELHSFSDKLLRVIWKTKKITFKILPDLLLGSRFQQKRLVNAAKPYFFCLRKFFKTSRRYQD